MKRRLLAAVRVAAAALGWAGGAGAESGAPAHEARTPRHAVSHEPLALLQRGFLVQGERLILPRWSLVAGFGARAAARGDFSSATWAGKAEARWWFIGRERLSRLHGMVGWHVAFALDAGRTAVTSGGEEPRDLGALWGVQETVRAGYRFVVLGVQEITLNGGLGLAHSFDERGRLAADTRLVLLSGGLTVGWLF